MWFNVTIQCRSCDHTAKQAYSGISAENVAQWLQTKNLVCNQCGSYGNVAQIDEKHNADATGTKKFIDRKQKTTENVSNSRSAKITCQNCGEHINAKRLETLPGTKVCANCAQSQPGNASTRYIAEPWGTREDWKRDRASWKRY